MGRALVGALGLIALMAISEGSRAEMLLDGHSRNLTAVLPLLPADHPVGAGATVTLQSLERAQNLIEPTISSYIVDYAPGGSAILHRTPSPGVVLVHVLSGAICASAWKAGVGTYRQGETWVEPALAHDISSKNASTHEPARAFVIVAASSSFAR